VPVKPALPALSRQLRIVVTRPPEAWFYGLARQYADLYTETLRSMGATLMVVPIEPFLSETHRGAAIALIEEIKSFRPDVAVGLHDAGYAISCRLRRREDGPFINVFAEWLGVPTVLIWDHALLQFASILIRLPDRPDESVPGCLSLFQRELSHPLFLHAARDSGHRQAVHDLGILREERILLEPGFAHPAFWGTAGEASPGRLADVGYIGHARPLRADAQPARHHASLQDVREAALQATSSDHSRPVQQELQQRLRQLPHNLRATLRLNPDESFYWSYLTSEVDVSQTRLRTSVIAGVDRGLSLFGDFGLDGTIGQATLRPERFAFGAELAAAFAGISVTIDVVNPGFIHGFGTKVMNCFAAGGFMLQDWKKDFIALFGELGEAVSYATLDDLRAKVDYFLSHERERRTIAAALAERIRAEHSLPHVFARLIDRGLQLRA
jgi:glycosyl transferase family 1